MKRAFSLKSEQQPAWLRHLGRVIFNDFSRSDNLSNAFHGDIPFEHALHSMDTKDNLGSGHLGGLLLLTRSQNVRDCVGSIAERGANATVHCIPIFFDCRLLILSKAP